MTRSIGRKLDDSHGHGEVIKAKRLAPPLGKLNCKGKIPVSKKPSLQMVGSREKKNSITEMDPGAVQDAQESTSSPTSPPDKVSVGGESHRLTTIDELSPNVCGSQYDGGSPNVDGNLNPQVHKFSEKPEIVRFFTKEMVTASVHYVKRNGANSGGYFICNGSRDSCPKCNIGEQPKTRCTIPAYWKDEHQVVLIEFNALGKNNKITETCRIIRDALKHVDDPAYAVKIRKPDQYSFEAKPGRLKNKSTVMEDAIKEFNGWWAANAAVIRIAPKLSWDEILERFPRVAEELEMRDETALDEFDEDLIEDLDELEDDGDEE